jgi:hypothetical protein
MILDPGGRLAGSKEKGETGLARLASARGVYQDGALEVVGDGLKVNWARLREPERLYEADFAWSQVRHGAVSLFFAKEDLDLPGSLRSRLELRYPVEKFLKHFWGNSREFHARLRETPLATSAGRSERASLRVESMHSAKDHSERVNFEYMAHFGTEASLDFYYLTPSGVARLAQGMGGDSLRILPVARVQITTEELLFLLDAAEPIARELAANLPRELTDGREESA